MIAHEISFRTYCPQNKIEISVGDLTPVSLLLEECDGDSGDDDLYGSGDKSILGSNNLAFDYSCLF
jgi:hypothetical protein